MKTTPLTQQSRQETLDHLKNSSQDGQELDVLVIGGGVTGAGVALDATTRGLTTVIVDSQDWASGTSQWSTKLVHGGLRYLQMLDFKLVHEALTERGLLLTKLAPHLVKAMPFLIPLEHRVWQRAYYGAGVTLYDALANIMPGRRALPIHRHRSHKGLAKKFPEFKPDQAIGAVEYYDATVDDARLVLTLVRTAASYGAQAASRTQVVEITKDGSGRANGAVLQDLETGEQVTCRAKHVINCTGVWTDDVGELADTEGGLNVLASKGIHIVIPRERLKGTSGVLIQTETSVLFFVPWSRYWIVGTTDTTWEEDRLHPVATSADIDYVLEHANAVLTTTLTRDDIIGWYAGLRPLLQPGTKKGTGSSKVSREHTVASPIPGLTVIGGGKLTTYRVMAKDAVDFAIGNLAKDLPCITDEIPLMGAVGEGATRRSMPALQTKFGWSDMMVDHLMHRYGSMMYELLDLMEADPSLAEPLAEAPAYLRAEIAYACSHEGVLHMEDLMMRRTRLIYETKHKGVDALPEIAAIAAEVLGWDSAKEEAEITSYREQAKAEELAAEQPDDAAASQARGFAGDPTTLQPIG